MPRVGNQNVDSDNRLHEGVRLHHKQINLERPQILRYRTWLHQPPEETIQRPQSISTDWRRKWHVRDQERNQTGWPSVKLALQHGSTYRKHWKTTFRAGKRKKVWESTWVTTTMTASNMRFADDVLLFASSKEQLQKWLCEFKRGVLKKWDSGFVQRRRKFLATKARHKKRNWGRWHESRNTDKSIKHEILVPDDYFPATGDDRNQKSNQVLGRRFTSTDRSRHRETTCSNIDSCFSTQW